MIWHFRHLLKFFFTATWREWHHRVFSITDVWTVRACNSTWCREFSMETVLCTGRLMSKRIPYMLRGQQKTISWFLIGISQSRLMESTERRNLHNVIVSESLYSSGSRGGGAEGAMPPPSPVQISHKKDGCQRRLHRFHVSWAPPTRPLDPMLL